jgi:hypothetical protein
MIAKNPTMSSNSPVAPNKDNSQPHSPEFPCNAHDELILPWHLHHVKFPTSETTLPLAPTIIQRHFVLFAAFAVFSHPHGNNLMLSIAPNLFSAVFHHPFSPSIVSPCLREREKMFLLRRTVHRNRCLPSSRNSLGC